MKNPYHDIVIDETSRYRRLINEAASAECTWHRDERDRTIAVISGDGWKIQFDDTLPVVLTPGQKFRVLAQEWHRILPGSGDLVLLINEAVDEGDAVDIAGVSADDPMFADVEDEAGVIEPELGDYQLEEMKGMIRQIFQEEKSDHERGYKAPEGSGRDRALDKAKAAYKRGDLATAIRIRDEMEKTARSKPDFKPRKSKYTEGEDEDLDESDCLDEGIGKSTREALKKKAEKHNAPLGALTTVYRKGLGAFYSSGSRPGMTAHQWAMARVNSFLKGGKARKVDSAQWKQVQKFRKE